MLATVVRARRPASAKAGDRALVLPDGTIEGLTTAVDSPGCLNGRRRRGTRLSVSSPRSPPV
ncbi:XdhC family protein [Nonomuraea glycinis]|nr:XdhC family protein [Nonomuraea glycinis]